MSHPAPVTQLCISAASWKGISGAFALTLSKLLHLGNQFGTYWLMNLCVAEVNDFSGDAAVSMNWNCPGCWDGFIRWGRERFPNQDMQGLCPKINWEYFQKTWWIYIVKHLLRLRVGNLWRGMKQDTTVACIASRTGSHTSPTIYYLPVNQMTPAPGCTPPHPGHKDGIMQTLPF